MITTTLGNINIGHHLGRKISLLSGNQIFAYAGDPGQAARASNLAAINANVIAMQPSALGYPITLANLIHTDFKQTGISASVNLNVALAFPFNGVQHCCIFEGAMQPRLLDGHHFFAALGSGALAAYPFLRFLIDTFSHSKQPSVKDAILLAYWAVQHTIDTSAGGVIKPICVFVAGGDGVGSHVVRELNDDDKQEHAQAVESATNALRKWRDETFIQTPGDVSGASSAPAPGAGMPSPPAP